MPDLQQIAEQAAGDPIPANCEVIEVPADKPLKRRTTPEIHDRCSSLTRSSSRS
jgi:hypothetical protein